MPENASSIFADLALTPEGWREDVRITLDSSGYILSVVSGEQPASCDRRLTGRAVVPALANLHSHCFQRAMAGLAERRASSCNDDFWGWREVMYRFLAHLTADDIEAIAAQAFVEMLESGFASLAEFHYLHHCPNGTPYAEPAELSLRILAAARQAGIGLTLLPVLYMQAGADGGLLEERQLRFHLDPDGYGRLAEAVKADMTGAEKRFGDYRLGIAPHSLRAVPSEAIDEACRIVPDGQPIHIHIAEQVREIEEIQAVFGARPMEFLLTRHDVDASWCLIHATHMEAWETEAFARSGAVAGLCPITEANLGDGIFDATRFLAGGGQFGIGSDSNVCISPAEELRMLEYGQRLKEQRRCVLAGPGQSTGRALYEAALVGGARALARPSGAIEAGRLCDLVALDRDHPSLVCLDGDKLLDGWIFAGGNNMIREVFSAGRAVVIEGHHIARDAIGARYRETMKRIASLL